MREVVFYFSIFSIFFAYAGYPLSIFILGLFKNKQIKRGAKEPFVTFIITAYNEETRIREKIENTLNINYPSTKLQVIVTSDGSDDNTNEIVEEYRSREIELLVIPERGGKERAQKKAIERARGEIIVFTDVATILEPVGVKEIVSNFTDPTIGCVSSEDRIFGEGGEGFYVRYEMWLRRLESSLNSLVGMSGSFFAARKEVCKDLIADLDSDFCVLLNSIKMGLRGVSDSRARGYYRDLSDEKHEFERKVRTVLRGITAFFRHTELLNVKRYGIFSYQYVCHKLLRWLVPYFLMAAFISNIFLAGYSYFYFFLLLMQSAIYGMVFLSMRNMGHRKHVVVKIPVYFITVNAAIAVAWWKYARGERIVMWKPSVR